MRNYIAFSFGVFLGLAMLVLLIQLQEGVPTSSSKWAHDLYHVKEEHARAAHSNKLLIVAGSNSLFGISATELEEKLHRPTTNFGVHAGLGLSYILERSKGSLIPGDIVYLPIEYALYQQDAAPSSQLMDFLLARDPEYFRSLPIAHQILGYANVSFGRIFEGLSGGSDRYEGRSAKVYNVGNVSPSGDQIRNSLEQAMSYTARLKGLQPKDIGNGKISEYSKSVLRQYFSWARENKICIVGAPPNLMYFEEYDSERFLDFFDEIVDFYRAEGVAFAGRPVAYLFPDSYFFDTEYHLNETGVAHRTRLTVRDLAGRMDGYCSYDAARY
ncbi:hypothetical protein JF535_01205 [Microbulbifer salipaludis]|uniref:SGNH hydrolase-type esterase domain-containing protein n=1 Tax=Microbulbifer salipaludis TaxID=187980 RepID=A0ABS3E2C6_9GAMM|nr:hypothetical protein [Microbulbifer salipaludis]MBN8429456.1 hypothetical protein [Microbulbifer salipaludis]